MPDYKNPMNANEFVQAVQAGFDEESSRLRTASDAEVEAELTERGIKPVAALERLHGLLDEFRTREPVKSASPFEALYQRCQQSFSGTTEAIRDDILGLLRKLSPDQVGQATTYAASIDPQKVETLEQFRQDLTSLEEDSPR